MSRNSLAIKETGYGVIDYWGCISGEDSVTLYLIRYSVLFIVERKELPTLHEEMKTRMWGCLWPFSDSFIWLCAYVQDQLLLCE
jgi:hypothetical protein